MMSSKKQVLLVALLLLAGIEILYWQILNDRKPVSVTIAVSESPIYAHLFVAQSLGYFNQERVKATLKVNSLATNSLIDLENGTVQMVAVLQTPVVRNIYEGKQISIVTSLHRSASSSAIIASKQSGILSSRDLRGKKIAAIKGGSSEYITALLLQSEGLKMSDVEIVDVTGDDAISALQNGTIDAIAALNSSLNRVERRMEGNYTKIYADVYTQVSLLVGNTGYILENEETITRILKALLKAEEYIHQHPDESLVIIKQWLPNLESEDVSINWDSNHYRMRLDNRLLTFLNREAKYFSTSSLLSNNTSRFRDHLFTEYLRKIKPDVVTVY